MKELLYLDRDRFERYSAQATPSLSKVEKTRELGAEFGITGPKASFGQKERVRSLTDFERMDEVLAALKKDSEIRAARPETEDDGPAFVHERCEATRVLVPYAASKGDFKNPEFALWLAPAPAESRSAMLCLLEDYRGDDERPVSFRQASTYTLLQSLAHYTRSHQLRTLFDDHVPNDPHPNPYARFDGKPDSLAQYHNVEKFAYDFATNPVALLQSWDCLPGTARTIDVLYRIREFGRDSAHSWQRVTVFGYPIWIVAE